MNSKQNSTRRLRPVRKIPGKVLLPQEKIPIWSVVLLGFAFFSFLLLLIARRNSAFADFFNRNIGAATRAILAFLTNFLPFSFAEFLLLMLPIALAFLTVYAIRHKTSSWRSVLSYTVSLLSAASLVFSLFIWNCGIGYSVPSLGERLGLANEPVSAEELAETARKLIQDMNDTLDIANYDANGASIMPYSLSDMSDKLMKSYRKCSERYTFLQPLYTNIKPVMLSVIMSYTHFTGFYTFFTGEANLNIDFPDYTLPFTAAHEFAHQRGIARENEANFIAFLICSESDDVYIRYCAYINLFEYVSSALWSADTGEGKELYYSVISLLDDRVRGEMKAYNQFFKKYSDSGISNITSALNDSFLKANGTEEGNKSYGLVVNLAVSYYKTR